MKEINTRKKLVFLFFYYFFMVIWLIWYLAPRPETLPFVFTNEMFKWRTATFLLFMDTFITMWALRKELGIW